MSGRVRHFPVCLQLSEYKPVVNHKRPKLVCDPWDKNLAIISLTLVCCCGNVSSVVNTTSLQLGCFLTASSLCLTCR